MGKRPFDIVFSLTALTLCTPLLLLISLAIKIGDPGPVFYIARRAGLKGKEFKLIKFRTMKINTSDSSEITRTNDNRVFLVGNILRKTKLDEIPQFFNVLLGHMSVVGPRPESIEIVEKYYQSDMYRSTLDVKPGIVSPGSLFNYTHGHLYLNDEDPIGSYVEKLLPIKLALEVVYIERQSWIYDLEIILRTIITVMLIAFGKKKFSKPKEFRLAKKAELVRVNK